MISAEEFLRQKGHMDGAYSPTAYVVRMMEEYAEQFKPKEVKDCFSCKYIDRSSDSSPCHGCDDFNNWKGRKNA